VKRAAPSHVCQTLAGQLVNPPVHGHKPGPVEPFHDGNTGGGVFCQPGEQVAVASIVVNPDQAFILYTAGYRIQRMNHDGGPTRPGAQIINFVETGVEELMLRWGE